MRQISLIEEDATLLSINEVGEDSVKLETESNVSSIEREMPVPFVRSS